MEKEHAENMDKFDKRAKNMIDCLNKLIAKKKIQPPRGAKQSTSEQGNPVMKIELNSFKNYYDHFRKPKHTENVFLKCIADIQ